MDEEKNVMLIYINTPRKNEKIDEVFIEDNNQLTNVNTTVIIDGVQNEENMNITVVDEENMNITVVDEENMNITVIDKENMNITVVDKENMNITVGAPSKDCVNVTNAFELLQNKENGSFAYDEADEGDTTVTENNSLLLNNSGTLNEPDIFSIAKNKDISSSFDDGIVNMMMNLNIVDKNKYMIDQSITEIMNKSEQILKPISTDEENTLESKNINIYDRNCLLENVENDFLPDDITTCTQEFIKSEETSEFKSRPSVLLHFDPCFLVSQNNENSEDNLVDIDNKEDRTELAYDLIEVIINKAFCLAQENNNPEPIKQFASAEVMADFSDKLAFQEEENAELKLQLNASQQVLASLELQLRQKEEIIIKSQTEALRKDQIYKQEMKQLKDKLEEKSVECNNSPAKELQETIKVLKVRESKLLSELNMLKNEEQNYRKLLDEYEKSIAAYLAEQQKLKEEHETVKRHFANLELAFSDVHQKYERSKQIIDGYKCNEEALRQTLMTSEDSVMKSEEKYESLKAHAKAQIEKSNQEIQLLRDQQDSESNKLNAIIRRLEIKKNALMELLDQKTKECTALATLCDDMTGNI